MGRKKGEEAWRLPGGFLDISDPSMLHACEREIREECGNLQLADAEYFTSMPIKDRRYKGTKDSVYTTVFKFRHVAGKPVAGDDLVEVAWIHINDVREGKYEFVHQEILDYYVE